MTDPVTGELTDPGRDRVGGEELLAIARETLLGELAPHIPEDRRYELLMVANAMAVAGRELAVGSAPREAEAARLEALLGDGGGITELNQRLVEEIRAGSLDSGERRAEALRHLWQTAADAVRLSSPRVLEGREEPVAH